MKNGRWKMNIRQIFAIAGLTLKENLRSKIFLALFLAGIIIITVSITFPVIGGLEDKIKLIESVSLQTITFFSMLIGAVLASTSLPKEIEDKSIYSIATKSVTRLSIIFGKAIGFVYIIGITIILLGGMSIILIRYTFSKVVAERDNTLNLNDIGLTNSKALIKIGEEFYPLLISRKEIGSVDFSINGEFRTTPGGINWIEGGGKAAAVWDITGLKGISLGKYIEVDMGLYLEGGTASIPLEVNISNTATNLTETSIADVSTDKRVMLKIDSQIAKGTDQIILTISPKYSGHYIGLRKEDIKIFGGYSSFECNFFKAILIIFLQTVLIIFIGIAGSTFLSTPAVSMLLALFIFFCGYMIDYTKDIFNVMNIQHLHNHSNEIQHVAKEPGAAFKLFSYALKNIFDLINLIVPDFNRFNIEAYILNRIDIPLKKVLTLLSYASVYLFACIGISAIFIRRREI